MRTFFYYVNYFFKENFEVSFIKFERVDSELLKYVYTSLTKVQKVNDSKIISRYTYPILNFHLDISKFT